MADYCNEHTWNNIEAICFVYIYIYIIIGTRIKCNIREMSFDITVWNANYSSFLFTGGERERNFSPQSIIASVYKGKNLHRVSLSFVRSDGWSRFRGGTRLFVTLSNVRGWNLHRINSIHLEERIKKKQGEIERCRSRGKIAIKITERERNSWGSELKFRGEGAFRYLSTIRPWKSSSS